PRIRVRRRHRPRTRRGEVLSRRAGHVAAGVGLSRGLSPRRSPVGDDGDGACRPHALRRGVRRRADHVMLLIGPPRAMGPMLEAITPWLPFNASHMLLGQALGEAPAGMSVWPPAVALLVPALGLAGAGLCAHVRRDSA